jgi:hypothetical protein
LDNSNGNSWNLKDHSDCIPFIVGENLLVELHSSSALGSESLNYDNVNHRLTVIDAELR